VASLEHVCIWMNNNWVKITAEEAARMHPGGKVSAYSGLFRCDLCGQYVTLTDGVKNARHFRHSSAEKDKDCKDRTFGLSKCISERKGISCCPLRITDVSFNNFTFEIGFIQVPSKYLESNMSIEILMKLSGSSVSSVKREYLGERLLDNKTTYLSVGATPCSDYEIRINNSTYSNELHKYWPCHSKGVDSDGTLFSVDTGKRLPYGADVVVGTHYYLLKNGKLYQSSNKHVTINQVCHKKISFNNWYLYDVVARDYSLTTANFFADYYCRLTDSPVSFIPIYPECFRESYITKHNSESMILYKQGNAEIESFPKAGIKELGDSLVEVSFNSRQQLISVGRSQTLKFSYYWKVPLESSIESLQVSVTDSKGRIVDSNNAVIPYKNTLVIRLNVDGVVYKKINGSVIDIIHIPADKSIDVDNIYADTEICVYAGLDKVWSAAFVDREFGHRTTDVDVLKRIIKCGGKDIAPPQTLSMIVFYLKDYPEIQDWIRGCVKRNRIPEKAYKELRAYVLENYDKGVVK